MVKPKQTKATNSSKVKRNKRTLKREEHENELKQLEEEAQQLDINASCSVFDQVPLCKSTRKGLSSSYFTSLTPIQKKALPAALKGKDILASAPTGSGKTLAFLVPVLEILYRKRWSALDGLGALIITPTRELALQIFQVLRNIGPAHSFSAGLVIGGKNVKDEKERVNRMNILVATPGRLLQHMDQTVGFDADNLQMLVLDEADRILDMGFKTVLNAIVQHLPRHRQTLLFSATQTNSVDDLARLSLSSPHIVDVNQSSHKDGDGADEEEEEEGNKKVNKNEAHVPKSLEQHYMVVPLEKKLDMLWSFIKTHLTFKTVVFISSCKQVRHIYETFRHLRPGVPLLQLHGKQKQMQRLEIFTRFSSSKNGILFATDIASRGLDFPGVDWVVQLDCPEDTNTYIHRVGRTARYQSRGKSLLFLTPSESEKMVQRLQQEMKLDVQEIRAKDNKQQSIKNSLQSFAFQYPEIKFLAQRAFISYVRSVYLQKDKQVFKFDDLPLEEYADSLGLVGAPKVNIIGQGETKNKKNASRALQTNKNKKKKQQHDSDNDNDNDNNDTDSDSDSDSDSGSQDEQKKPKTKYERMFGRKNQSVLSEHFNKLVDREQDDQDDDQDDNNDFITLSRRDHQLDPEVESQDVLDGPVSKRQAKKLSKKKSRAMHEPGGKKLVFDEDGQAHEIYELIDEDTFKQEGDANELGKKFVEAEKKQLSKQDIEDRLVAKEKRKEKRLKRKRGGLDDDEGDDDKQVIVPIADQIELDPSVFAPLDDDDASDDNDNYSRKHRQIRRHADSDNDSDEQDEDLEAKALAALKRRRTD